MLRTKAGVVNAARHREQLPKQGDFRLVEMRLEDEGNGYQLTGVFVYRLAAFGALANLCRSDEAILSSIVEPGSLNRSQKYSVWELLRQQMMPEIWERSAEALKQLSNEDGAVGPD